MKSLTRAQLPFVAIAFVLLLAATVLQVRLVQGSAPSGLTATVATTSNPTVTTSAALVFATTSPSCTSRTIGTAGSAITITFSDNQGKRPTGIFGFPQAASTTVTYDGGQFGCGAVYIYSFATQAITVQETQ